MSLLDQSSLLRRPSLLDRTLQEKASLLDRRFFGPCGCIGPQNGEPLCPCQMRSVQVVDGRYVRAQDLGPA